MQHIIRIIIFEVMNGCLIGMCICIIGLCVCVCVCIHMHVYVCMYGNIYMCSELNCLRHAVLTAALIA